MSRHPGNRQSILVVRTAFIALATIAIASAPCEQVISAELVEQAHSLRKVPADAVYYSASLRLKEQWDAFLSSKAYSKLMEIPLVQFVKMQVSFQWQQSDEPVIAKVREYFESPAGQDGVAVLKEMFSDECFVYGGGDIAETFKLFVELNSLRRTVRLEALTKGKDEKDVTVDRVMEILEKHSETFKVPTMVFGFRIKDQARAKRELDEVHSLLRNVLDENQPDLAAHLHRDQIGGNEFLTLRLDGTMLPWDEIREAADNKLDDAQFEKLKGFVSKHKLAVALGVTDEFILISVGESTDHLEKLGQGPVLADQPAIKRLQKHADQRLVTVTYASKVIAQSFGSAQQTLEDLAGAAEEGLAAAKVSEQHRKQIVDDIRGLNLARYMPEPGDSASVCFLTARGYEGFKYTDAKRPMMDSSKPLTILNHVGGNPMVLIASRGKQKIEDYEQAVTWLKQTAGHVEEIAKEKADPDDWEKYQEIRKEAVVLLKRLDEANRKHLYPALADGQGAFVMDFSATSKQWFNQIPESPKPLPMLEMAFVAGVSDAEHLRQGVATYIEVAREAYKLIRERNKDAPDLKIPKAQVSEISDGGKLYSYPLPTKWGVDPQIAINAGLSEKVVTVSTMPKTTERMLRETTPNFDTSLQLDRPAAMVTHVEFKKLVDAVRPWIDYGVDVASGKLKAKKDDGDDADKEQAPQNPVMLQMGFVVPQVHQFLDVASALRSASSVTYEENGVWITHSETHIQDLK